MTNEILNMEQLDNVAGGTCQETDEIIDAIGEVRFIASAPHKLERAGVEAHLSVVYGIVAETHNGFLFFSDGAPNTYELKNGKKLTHKEVIQRIKENKREWWRE